MTFEYVWKETKDDGWSYDKNMSISVNAVYGMDEDTWDKIMLAVYHDRRFHDAKDMEGRRMAIWMAIEEELDSIRERLMYDLQNNVKIYPLIKRKGEKK